MHGLNLFLFSLVILTINIFQKPSTCSTFGGDNEKTLRFSENESTYFLAAIFSRASFTHYILEFSKTPNKTVFLPEIFAWVANFSRIRLIDYRARR